jgi:hypothetical protein
MERFMPSFRLQVLIEPRDLEIVRWSEQRIFLARSVSADSPNMVWLSIEPRQSTDVQWVEEFGIYSSTSQFRVGERITKLSETSIPVRDGCIYRFTRDGTFTGPFRGGVGPGSYSAENDTPYNEYPVLTFGLTQSAVVNQVPIERKPISATSVLAGQLHHMTPFPNMLVWLGSALASETFIAEIRGNSTSVTFSGRDTDIVIKYDGKTGRFVAGSPTSRG